MEGGGAAIKLDSLITKIVECWLFFLRKLLLVKKNVNNIYFLSTHCTGFLIKNETLLTSWTLMRFNLVLGVKKTVFIGVMFNDLIIYQFKKSLNAICPIFSEVSFWFFFFFVQLNIISSYIAFLNHHIFIDFCFKRFQIVFGNLKTLIMKE